MFEGRDVQHLRKLQLYQSFQLYLRCAQLLSNVPCCLARDLPSRAYFKQARCLLTAGTFIWVILCCYQATVKLLELPIPFFTAVLYVNEMVLNLCITVQTMLRGYSETVRYSQCLERIVTVAATVSSSEWTELLLYLRLRLYWFGIFFTLTSGVGLAVAHLFFGGIWSTLFTMGAYVLPNMLASMSLAQYYAGTVLIYKLQHTVNQQLRTAIGKHRAVRLQEIKHLYLQLDHCVQLMTRSYEVAIVTNVFLAINVTSLLLLEIYQYLQANELQANSIYIVSNVMWLALYICLLLMVLYPCDMIKREMALLRLLTLGRKRIVPTACGLLKLELSSLSSVSGRVVRFYTLILVLTFCLQIFVALLSFMIILIQFDSAKLNKRDGRVTAIDQLYTPTNS
ncbi:putative gustatory receptor 59f [Anopheles gambiae]|uniref:putative gustatory receptor 59f n=1 Tax=Anopheles gambiae TaxID=7165 RepID=UPI002AC8F977|nr:putative gustatory receptor 59f [Anopheles gambiae]